MDFNVDPCEDFFNYACANWNKEHIIPDDRTSISTFEVMADKLQIQLRRTPKSYVTHFTFREKYLTTTGNIQVFSRTHHRMERCKTIPPS